MTSSAYVAALRMLTTRRLTEAALFARLERKGYPEDEVGAAVTRCKAERFLDDRLFAQLHVESALERRNVGDRRIVAELVRKGVDPDAARAAVSSGQRPERERAQAALERMLRVEPGRGYASLARALERLGFHTPLIYEVLRRHAAQFGPLAELAEEASSAEE
ncbi:regulatory protein RecX [bacterium]|nr:MAG: regulatory protein RecX [bacterium]